MATILNSAKATLSQFHKVEWCVDMRSLEGDIVLLDAVAIDRYGNTGDVLNQLAEDQTRHPNRKYILWGIEKTMLRLRPEHRDWLLGIVDIFVVSTPYLYDLLDAINVTPYGYLCDCVCSNLFRPRQKELSVTAVGALKHIKNVDFVVDVFQLLEGKIKRMYFGSSELWSNENRVEDAKLTDRIKRVTEYYSPNASLVEVAYFDGQAAIAVNDTWHDTSSRSNEELLMAGAISVHGPHEMFSVRPGFTVKTPQEAVDVIEELTEGFTGLPDPTLHEESRNWALEHLSADTFMRQFNNIMRNFI